MVDLIVPSSGHSISVLLLSKEIMTDSVLFCMKLGWFRKAFDKVVILDFEMK